MRVPLEWLRTLVEFDDTPEGLAERLTFGGIEVEAIERVGADYTGVVVGEVRSVERHPNADRLSVCRVWDGQAERVVVCGAPNVHPGGRYALAVPGCRLPNGMEIRPARLRGVESHGMLCAEDELGLSDDHAGLLALPEDAAPGTPLRDVLGGPDVVFDLEITPNRPDCLCLLGVAREVAALYRVPLRPPPTDARESPGEAPAASAVHVTVEPLTLCPRYTARLIRGVRLGPSPRWMQTRLSRAGVRPICNVVDITNYVMLEMGQPLHAFDFARLEDRRILVRRAADGERIRTLDGQERALDRSVLVIADARRAVALAGIMGGEGSEVSSVTTDILLESAAFSPTSIRATSRRLGLATESSHRFARGVDPELADRASRRAAGLLAELAAGRVAPGAIDIYPAPVRPRRLACRVSAVEDLLGLTTDTPTVAAALESLGFEVQPAGEGVLDVTAPTFRVDIEQEVDLIEEFARLHGLERIPPSEPCARLVAGADDRDFREEARVREVMWALGLVEAMNYSLTAEALLDRFGLDDASLRVRLPNPISVEQAILRTALIPQLVETLGRNRARQVADAAMVEFGRVFVRSTDGRVEESARVAIGLMGAAGRPPLARRPAPTPEEAFGWLHGLLSAAADALRVPAPAYRPAPVPCFEPGMGFDAWIGPVRAGRAGILRASLAAEWRFYEPIAVAELDLAPLTAGLSAAPSPAPPPALPCSERDLAFLVPASVRNEEILAVMRAAAPPALERVALFDVYTGRGVPPGQKSMAYSLTYRLPDRTITDDEVQRYQGAIAAAVEAAVGARLRDR